MSASFQRSANDLVGFQTGDDAFNFSRYLTRECGLHSHDFNFTVAERTMYIGAFRVGIETAAFASLAHRSERLPFVQHVFQSLAGRALIIGVDRLDYSKEISARADQSFSNRITLNIVGAQPSARQIAMRRTTNTSLIAHPRVRITPIEGPLEIGSRMWRDYVYQCGTGYQILLGRAISTSPTPYC